MAETRLLTAAELAAELQVKPSTVAEWSRVRRIPTLRFSAKVLRFDLDEVLEALKRKDDRAAAPAPVAGYAAAGSP